MHNLEKDRDQISFSEPKLQKEMDGINICNPELDQVSDKAFGDLKNQAINTVPDASERVSRVSDMSDSAHSSIKSRRSQQSRRLSKKTPLSEFSLKDTLHSQSNRFRLNVHHQEDEKSENYDFDADQGLESKRNTKLTCGNNTSHDRIIEHNYIANILELEESQQIMDLRDQPIQAKVRNKRQNSKRKIQADFIKTFTEEGI